MLFEFLAAVDVQCRGVVILEYIFTFIEQLQCPLDVSRSIEANCFIECFVTVTGTTRYIIVWLIDSYRLHFSLHPDGIGQRRQQRRFDLRLGAVRPGRRDQRATHRHLDGTVVPFAAADE